MLHAWKRCKQPGIINFKREIRTLLRITLTCSTCHIRTRIVISRPPANVALIGNIPISGLSTRNNSAICGAILSGHIGRPAVSYFHPEFSFSSRSGQHDERRDLLRYNQPSFIVEKLEARRVDDIFRKWGMKLIFPANCLRVELTNHRPSIVECPAILQFYRGNFTSFVRAINFTIFSFFSTNKSVCSNSRSMENPFARSILTIR